MCIAQVTNQHTLVLVGLVYSTAFSYSTAYLMFPTPEFSPENLPKQLNNDLL